MLPIRLLLLASATFIYVTFELYPVGLIADMARDLGTTEAAVGLLVGGYAVVSACVTIPSVRLARRMPAVQALLISLAALLVSELLTATATTYPLLAASRVLAALTHGLFWSLIPAVSARLVAPERTGRVTSVVFAGAAVALVAGSPLTTLLGHAIGWRETAGVMAIWTAVTLVGLWAALPRGSGASATSSANGLAQRVNWRAVKVICGMCLCAVAAHYVSYTYVAVIITRLMRGDGLLVTALTVFGVAGTAGTLSVGLHNDRHPRAGIVLATGTYSAGVAALCGATVLGSPVWRAASILTAMTLCGVGYGSFGPVSQAGVIRAAPSRQDVASSYYVTTFQVAIAAGSGLGALVVDDGPTGALPVVTLSMMGPVAVAAVMLRHAYGASQAGSDAPAAAEGPAGVRPR